MEQFIEQIKTDKEILLYLIDTVKPEYFIELAGSAPEFQETVFKGFAVKQENLVHIRVRLLSWYKNNVRKITTLCEAWKLFHKPLIDFFDAMSDSFMQKHKGFFMEYFQAEFFIVLEGVAEKSTLIATEHAPADTGTSSNEMLDCTIPFIEYLKCIIPSEAAVGETEKADPVKSETKAGAGEKKLEKLRKKLAERESELEALKSAYSDLAKNHDGLEKKHNSLIKSAAVQKEQFVKDAAELEISIRKKMRLDFESIDDEREFAAPAEENRSVIVFAEQAIKLQSAKNKRSGTLHSLREEFKHICELIETLRQIQGESLLTVPETAKALDMLQQRREYLLNARPYAAVLVESLPSSKFSLYTDVLDTLPLQKASLPILEQSEHLLQQLREKGFIDRQSARKITESIRQKLHLIIAKEAGMSLVQEKKSIQSFEQLVQSGSLKKSQLMIDGNNVLLRSLDRKSELDGFTSMASARNVFHQRISRKARHFANIIVVYDGTEDSEISEPGYVIMFTEKSEELADDRLTRIIALQKKGSVILVTDDIGLIERNPGAQILSSRHCYDFFMSDK
ncbi:MAG: NYN domain-containing protein [Nitrospira sp.]|nr:NYN domain-containing protein [bacterium]MBL7049426.1 NYN domain-containing protein [Nitrospira sp.]